MAAQRVGLVSECEYHRMRVDRRIRFKFVDGEIFESRKRKKLWGYVLTEPELSSYFNFFLLKTNLIFNIANLKLA